MTQLPDLGKYLQEAAKNSPPRIEKLRGKDLFLRFIEEFKEQRAKEDVLYKAGLDAYNFYDGYHAQIQCLMNFAFNPEQVGWIEWWMYEHVEKVVTFTDGRAPLQLDTPESLWDFLQTIKP